MFMIYHIDHALPCENSHLKDEIKLPNLLLFQI